MKCDKDCGHLNRCWSEAKGTYFLCTGFKVRRKVRREGNNRTYYDIHNELVTRQCPIVLEKDKDGDPVKLQRCIDDYNRVNGG